MYPLITITFEHVVSLIGADTEDDTHTCVHKLHMSQTKKNTTKALKRVWKITMKIHVESTEACDT